VSAALQLTFPTLEDAAARADVPNALVEVVVDEREGRVRVRPVDRTGWVKFPKRLRVPGALYRVGCLRPRPGGAWTATGAIRRVRGARRRS
jgi:hypothetical protein